MGIAERKARQKEGLRQEILDAARDLVLKEGYESVSMRKIAEKIEYSPTTIYLYFKDKNELVESLCEETFALLLATLERIGAQHTDPIEQMRACCRAYVNFGLQHPDYYRVTFLISHEVAVPYSMVMESMAAKAFMYLRTGVEACIAKGKFRKVDVEITSQALWAALHGITALLIVKKGFPWADKNQVIDAVIDGAIRGLMA
jgi:AcrR family transcriptional regulator